MGLFARLVAVLGLAGAHLRHERTRSLLSVAGVALAVLAATLLTATGVGVLETGQRQFDAADRDLWITGGPVEFAPGTVGGVESSIRDSHRLADELSAREDVGTAAPLLFQSVYVRANGSDDYRTVAAFGVPSAAGVRVTEGREFRGDPHYAGGAYDGPMTHEVLVDRRTAELLGVAVGDRIGVGGTVAAAREHEFVIVGISPTGAPRNCPLSELQEITGKTGTDPATLVTVTTAEGARVDRTERALQRAYPAYEVRTNAEQLRATVERQAVVLAGGASLVALAVLAGVALSLNALLSMVVQGLESYAALKALGTSTTTLALVALVQTLLVGALGGLVGLGLAVPLAAGLNRAVRSLVGFAGVVQLTPRILALGGGVAVGVGPHSLIAASLSLILGFQTLTLGVFAKTAGDPVQAPADPLTGLLTENLTLEQTVFGGGLLVLGSVGYAALMVGRWVASGFRALPLVDYNIMAMTGIVVGVLVVFNAFLLSVVADD